MNDHPIPAPAGEGRESVLPSMQGLLKEFGYPGEDVVNEVPRRFQLSRTEVFPVASFHQFLNTKQRGRQVNRIRRTVSRCFASTRCSVTG